MSDRLPDFALLETLVRISEEGSFSRAAERLNLSQQSVSGQVKKLEAIIGKRLVDRTTHSVRLSAAGEALVVYAKSMLRMGEQIRQHFRVDGSRGTLRLGIPEGFAVNGLPVALEQLRRIDNRLEIHAQTGETEALILQLKAGSLDLVVGMQRPGEGQGEVLCSDRLRWIGNVGNLHDPAQALPLVMMPEPDIRRALVFEALSGAGRPWIVLFESRSRASLMAAAHAGLGVTVQGLWMSRMPGEPAAVAEGELPELGEVEYFLRRRPVQNSFIDAFADILRAMVPGLVKSP